MQLSNLNSKLKGIGKWTAIGTKQKWLTLTATATATRRRFWTKPQQLGWLTQPKGYLRRRNQQHDQRIAKHIFWTDAAGHERHWLKATKWDIESHGTIQRRSSPVFTGRPGQAPMHQVGANSTLSNFQNYSSGLPPPPVSWMFARKDTQAAVPTFDNWTPMSNNSGTLKGWDHAENRALWHQVSKGSKPGQTSR